MVNQEYDAFGPWIYEVNQEHRLPPLFVPYYKENDSYLMLIKIPRNIERRNAEPGMDLYDYVIGMYEDFVYILKRKDKSVEEIKVLYSEIEGIEDLRQLLKGTLTIYLKNSKVIIPFNTVSGDIVMKLTKIIRDRYTKNTFMAISDFCSNKDLNVDIIYINLLKDMESNGEDVHICAVQPNAPVNLRRSSIVRKMYHILVGKVLLNTLHLLNNKELIILSRGKTFKDRRLANYDYAFTYIPIERLDGIEIKEHQVYDNLAELTLKLSANEIKFYFEKTRRESFEFYNKFNEGIKLARA